MAWQRYTWVESDGCAVLISACGRWTGLLWPEGDTPEARGKMVERICRRYNPHMRRLFPRARYGQHTTYA